MDKRTAARAPSTPGLPCVPYNFRYAFLACIPTYSTYRYVCNLFHLTGGRSPSTSAPLPNLHMYSIRTVTYLAAKSRSLLVCPPVL